ncbi:hypothetical protein SAMN05444159_7320 [Bradyrhizobium lablabi]|uniref:Uncharacterized protein n=1 Tax=Bradyrhizobium lablabi TaxID=722472 RepID=A0A1M7EYW9_9BRAD|nr:hypothetical protein [Bradyrhizobium lablabi]SHL96727.1 hypothetical protein SAMN05444159_7320 [Bradyrhizobium lablabi]
MTHKIVKMMLTGAAFAMLAAAPALAQCPTCGLGTVNGLSTNLLTTNAQSTNSAGELGRVVAVELPRR